jgi:hypothetical protein
MYLEPDDPRFLALVLMLWLIDDSSLEFVQQAVALLNVKRQAFII